MRLRGHDLYIYQSCQEPQIPNRFLPSSSIVLGIQHSYAVSTMTRLSLRSCFIAATLLFSSTNVLANYAWQNAAHWVDTWTSMPQLTEPANLPPAPYVHSLLPHPKPPLTTNRIKQGPSSSTPQSVKPSTCHSVALQSASKSPTPSEQPISPSPP